MIGRHGPPGQIYVEICDRCAIVRVMAKRGTKLWLMKSEPDVFSIDDLRKKRRGEPWDGVRNYQARNYLRDMAEGDLALFYHSNAKPPGVAGICRIVSSPYPDPTQFDPKSEYYDSKSSKDDPRWTLVDVEFVEKFDEEIPLQAMKDDPALQGMRVTQKGSRLSVQPVDKKHFKHVLKLANAKTKLG
jgi:predicted RNA-binding protein with PUA-like domain